jgi:eukaryotic-like serine/threonine-protein kinase
MSNGAIDNRYRLEERIATGGMAEVWAAHDLELDRRVAVKLLHHGADPARFSREARAVAGLSHPGICRVYDYGDADGRPYIVLEYLAGGTLDDRLARGQPLPDDDAARIARELASALAYAHARGLVHRDLKPGNVLFDLEGSAKISDFGIAQVAGAPTLTEAGTLLGTAAYISPEQASGERVTPASDVYSFGVIVYQMLTGRLPFEAESALELAAKHVSEEPAAIASLRPDAPSALERVATAALAKRPEDRPADGGALLEALEGGIGADAATAVLTPPPPTTDVRTESIPPRRRARVRWLASGAALAALAAGGLGAALLAESDGPVTEQPPPVRSENTGAATDATTTGRTTRPAATAPTTTREGPTSRRRTSPGPETSATTEPTSATTATSEAPKTTTPPETPTLPLPTTAADTVAPPTTTAPETPLPTTAAETVAPPTTTAPETPTLPLPTTAGEAPAPTTTP